jgi:hypothetical protein
MDATLEIVHVAVNINHFITINYSEFSLPQWFCCGMDRAQYDFDVSQKGVVMKNDKQTREEDYTYFPHYLPARPLKYVKDRGGYGWLCDKEVDAKRDLREQGCWRCDEMAFPTGGR